MSKETILDHRKPIDRTVLAQKTLESLAQRSKHLNPDVIEQIIDYFMKPGAITTYVPLLVLHDALGACSRPNFIPLQPAPETTSS